MLDNVGLIHMNGRVYDPELGRFVSADPKVPDPFNSQAFNRYTYVYNNPLSFTDPDGFSPKSGDDSSSSDFGFGWGDLASFAVGFTPAGIAADIYGAVTGEDLFTGEKLTPWERATNVIPGASEARKIGKAAKAVQEAAEKLAKKEADAKKAAGPKGKGSGNGKDSKDPKDPKDPKVTKSTLHKRGDKPQPGERTLEGYVSNAAKQKEIGLNTNSTGFDVTGPKQFKRFGADSHAGISPHVHQPIRNTTPKGPRGTTGSKTKNGGVTSPSQKDVKQLYNHLNNGKY
ncbi:hypothetical protein TW85_13955 [Marinomonas sp. S3726]|nr:hypothetical protein TW85_13955 [Marinomonas sp. S3726]